MISASLRRPGFNAFYWPGGERVVLREPRVTLAQVARYVEAPGWRARTYLVDQRRWWDSQPLYVLDELNAYTWGAEVALEDAASGRPLERTDATAGCLEFCVYAVALADCVAAEDREFWLGPEGDRLRAYLVRAIGRARRAYRAGLEIPEYRSEKSSHLVAGWETLLTERLTQWTTSTPTCSNASKGAASSSSLDFGGGCSI